MEKIDIFWTENASNNLQSIFKYIANDSIFYAEKFVQNLIHKTNNQLSIFPLSGRFIPEFKNTSIHFLREVIFGNYRIVYRYHLDQNKVSIIAVINAKMDLPNHISPWMLK